MRKKQRQMAIAAVVMLAVAVIVAVFQYRPEKPPEFSAYFFDEDTGQEVEVTGPGAHAIPPATAPSGKETRVYAVHAFTISGQQREIVYLKKYPPAVKSAMEKAVASEGHIRVYTGFDQQALVRSPVPGSPWMAANSPQGAAFLRDAESKLVIP